MTKKRQTNSEMQEFDATYRLAARQMMNSVDEGGFKSLLNIDSNAKTVKDKGYMTASLYLAPHTLADSKTDLCPYSTVGCRAACLYNDSGITRDDMSAVQGARVARTKYFLEDRLTFMEDLEKEIARFVERAEKKGLIPVVRLNGTSDIDWNFYYDCEQIKRTIFSRFPKVQFYDCTKDTLKMLRKQPPNYYLTYSYNENSQKDYCYDLLQAGNNVVVVMDEDSYASAVDNGAAIDGEQHDLRFLDEPGKLVVLKAKGRATKDKHGFVWREVVYYD